MIYHCANALRYRKIVLVLAQKLSLVKQGVVRVRALWQLNSKQQKVHYNCCQRSSIQKVQITIR